MTRQQTLDDFNGADMIDVRDVIARVEFLRDELHERTDEDDATELATLTKLLNELCGYGGDEQWEGDWYPVTLIRDGYFKRYAQEFADDIGAVPSDAQWPMTCIDWDQAARELRMDYSSVDLDNITYWYR